MKCSSSSAQLSQPTWCLNHQFEHWSCQSEEWQTLATDQSLRLDKNLEMEFRVIIAFYLILSKWRPIHLMCSLNTKRQPMNLSWNLMEFNWIAVMRVPSWVLHSTMIDLMELNSRPCLFDVFSTFLRFSDFFLFPFFFSLSLSLSLPVSLFLFLLYILLFIQFFMRFFFNLSLSMLWFIDFLLVYPVRL